MAKARIGGKVSYVPKGQSNKGHDTHKIIPGLKKLEDRIRPFKREQAHIFDMDGNLYFKKQGGKNRVSFMVSDLNKMRDKILTHNHPGQEDGGFSAADIRVMNDYGLLEVRAVSGTGGVHSLKRIGEVSGNIGSDFAEADKGFFREVSAQVRVLRADYFSGKISIEQANQKITEANNKLGRDRSKWLRDNAEKYGYYYSFERG